MGVEAWVMEIGAMLADRNLKSVPNVPIFRYFWLAALACNVVNSVILKLRLRRYTAAHPELAAGYQRYYLGNLVWTSLPWIVMGIGILFGGVPNVFSYLNPHDSNPYILAWYGCILLLWLSVFGWLFVGGGAEFLVQHPGLLSSNLDTVGKVRGFFGLASVGSVIGLYVLFTSHHPMFSH